MGVRNRLILLGLVLAFAMPAFAQGGSGRRAGAPGPGPDGPPIQLVNAGRTTSLTLEAVRRAASGTIDRNGQAFPFTPLVDLLKANGVAANALLRVSAGDDPSQMPITLQAGSKQVGVYDPAHFGFVFNMRGQPVLTPRPGTPPAAAPVVADRPQVRGVTRIEVVAR
jgi:hypothetical protein